MQNKNYGHPDLTLPEGVISDFVDNGNGLRMHVLRSEKMTKDSALVLLMHGFPELAYSWRKIIPPLMDAGYVVVAPDQRGYGETIETQVTYSDDITPYNFANLAKDAVGLINALGYKHAEAIIGHDSGSFVAGTCSLLYPEFFRSCVMMSAPFTGAPLTSPSDSNYRPKNLSDLDVELLSLSPPRKHYQVYFSGETANQDLLTCSQGVHNFLRAYYHHKSADWIGNKPFQLKGWDAAELAKMPTYYIMEANKTMPETVAEFIPTDNAIAACEWLTEDELNIYSSQYQINGFQGGMQWYRCMIEGVNRQALLPFSGRTIDVPSMFLSGSNDWGNFQAPGSLEHMRDTVCTNMISTTFIDNAGHWVQQEQSQETAKYIIEFLRSK
jgi:pimeloyl-ACP methyl ester carboxylesterase